MSSPVHTDVESTVSDEEDVNDRVEYAMVDGIVDVSIAVVVKPPGLKGQEPLVGGPVAIIP